MIKQLRPALLLFVAFTLLFGLAYPVFVWGIAQASMPSTARGSLIERNGKIIGSSLIAQNFESERYFWPRPMTGASASNLSPTNTRLRDRVRAEKAILDAVHPDQKNIPADLLMASGSGHDPDISPESAMYQAGRVAKARGIPPNEILKLVDAHTKKPTFGFLGSSRVNVLDLNLALDAITARSP